MPPRRTSAPLIARPVRRQPHESAPTPLVGDPRVDQVRPRDVSQCTRAKARRAMERARHRELLRVAGSGGGIFQRSARQDGAVRMERAGESDPGAGSREPGTLDQPRERALADRELGRGFGDAETSRSKREDFVESTPRPAIRRDHATLHEVAKHTLARGIPFCSSSRFGVSAHARLRVKGRPRPFARSPSRAFLSPAE